MSSPEMPQSTTTQSENINGDLGECECIHTGNLPAESVVPRRNLVIGVAGGTGSGKTTVAKRLKQSYPPHCVQVIAQDSYYRDQSDIPFEERHKTNYDHPDAYDNDLLIEHLTALKRGEVVQQPIYSFITHTRVPETRLVKPAHVLIVEGILALEDVRLRNLMDVKIFVQTDADVRFIRRLKRDIMERGRAMNDVIDQYLKVVRPMHMLYTEPSKRYADIIIPEGGSNAVAIGMVRGWIDLVLNKVSNGERPRVNYFGQEASVE